MNSLRRKYAVLLDNAEDIQATDSINLEFMFKGSKVIVKNKLEFSEGNPVFDYSMKINGETVMQDYDADLCPYWVEFVEKLNQKRVFQRHSETKETRTVAMNIWKSL